MQNIGEVAKSPSTLTAAEIAAALSGLAEYFKNLPAQTEIDPSQLELPANLRSFFGKVVGPEQFLLPNEAAKMLEVTSTSVSRAIRTKRLKTRMSASGRKVVHLGECKELFGPPPADGSTRPIGRPTKKKTLK